MDHRQIADACSLLSTKRTRGELGQAIASLVRSVTRPATCSRLRRNFARTIRDFAPEYRDTLDEAIAGHLYGTFQAAGRMHELGVIDAPDEPLALTASGYWTMVVAQCSAGSGEEDRLRFLKFLLEGFCMFAQGLPGHPVGMPFPGGDRVAVVDGTYYCPVREKANDVDSALCPFCPALQTPEIGYLRPPVRGSEHRKQEFIEQTYRHHHFNG